MIGSSMPSSFDASAHAATVQSLLDQMTLDQKLGQMMQPERMSISPEEVAAHHIGSVLSGGGSVPGANRAADWVAMNDAYWAASMQDGPDRTPVPILYGVDAVHGHANVLGATVFPHNIGLGAARDPELVERIARCTAREILATGVEWTFAPTLAVAQDIRWGRTYESYSEHTEVVTSYAAAMVRGLQGDLGRDSVMACAKHWIGDGGTRGGRDQGNTIITEDELVRVHMTPYLPALEAGVLTVMASFNSWNGVKCHGNRYLLTEVLKGKLGFAGFVISDWDGTDYLSEDYGEAVAIAVNAGVDMLMVSIEWRKALAALKAMAANGTIPTARIDDAVRRILTVKAHYGLFERPRPAARHWSTRDCLGDPEHRTIAREAVRKSLVLLTHDGTTLPLRREAAILVAGRNADNRGHQCGGFTVEWQGVSGNDQIEGGTSIWEAIRTEAPASEFSFDGSAADSTKHDVAVVVIGERPYAEGMGDLRPDPSVNAGSNTGGRVSNLVPYGSSLELAQLHPEDLATIRRITAAGIPCVVVMISGRPLITDLEIAESAAFVAAWLPGSEGAGVTDVLFGHHDFQGTLPFSWPAGGGSTTNPAARFPVGHGLRMR
jgi:beta-glucosidase